MALSPTAYRFTVKDYHRMAEADVFAPEDRLELFGGEVYEMAPIGSRHAAVARGESVAPVAFPDAVPDVAALIG